MLRVASLAPNLLLEAGERVVEFLGGQFNEDGGAKDRSGESDLYYTVFAIEGLMAMGVDPPVERVVEYLRDFGNGDELDLVHKACLARCWAAMPCGGLESNGARRILEDVESYRSADGGYGPERGADKGTVYHCFLALGVYEDLTNALPNPNGLGRCLARLRTDDGAFANDDELDVGTTPATAAAATLLRQLDMPVPPSVGDWLLARCLDKGGFLAMPEAPFPDLLSTATALHALAGMGISVEKIKEPCLNFLDTLWTGQAFCGLWLDDVPDCEYTYYALLTLGHLSF